MGQNMLGSSLNRFRNKYWVYRKCCTFSVGLRSLRRGPGLRAMAFRVRAVAKAAVQAILVVILFRYFGLPSWQRYREEKTVVTSTEMDLGEITAPSVTVCATNSETMIGFRNNSVSRERFADMEIVGEVCKDRRGGDIVRCVEEQAYNLSAVVNFARKGIFGKNLTGSQSCKMAASSGPRGV